MEAVVAEGITKNHGAVRALNEVSFAAQEGEIFGLIGPDGAGKTTMFRILTTLLLPDAGSARIAGHDAVKEYRQIRHKVGYMPGRFSLYQDLTVAENLRIFASVFHTSIEENYHLIRDIYVQIEPFSKRRAGALSGGMKQKLALCCALIHKPEVLFLDEPTTGVDPVSRREFWDMLGRLKKEGITMVVSTPYMNEAALCDRIALIRQGEILRTDTPAAMRNGFGKKLWAVRSSQMSKLLSDVRSYPNTLSCNAFGDAHHLILNNDNEGTDALTAFLQQRGHDELSIRSIDAGVEDCFLEMTRENQ